MILSTTAKKEGGGGSQQGNKTSPHRVPFIHPCCLSFSAFFQALLNSDLGMSCTVGSHLNFETQQLKCVEISIWLSLEKDSNAVSSDC